MKNCIAIFLSLFAGFTLRAQSFPAGEIPDSLKENANVVIRRSELTIEIKSIGHAINHKHLVYTILNEKGDDYATYDCNYDKFTTINSVSGYLYDANGKELKRFKKKDMIDRPLDDGEAFVNDDRNKKGSFYCHSYPYTVEFEEEDEINGFMGIEGWLPQPSVETSVEFSKYTITVPADYEIRYKLLNATITPDVEDVKNSKKSYSWEIRSLSAYEDVPFNANWVRYSPYLLVGLTGIEEEGYKGSMSTWNDFAKFYGSLQRGRDVLPEDIKQKVHQLTDKTTDPEMKVAILYDYLQKNTHYVGIQLGIGGWQTLEASFVAHTKYGDCKALSNFMVALLKEAGIKGHAVVIYGGEQPMDFVKDFTYSPFNHIICCVPLAKDTIWLECTSQYYPPGYLSEFTANRYGLLIDENGGSLVHTPVYSLHDNVQVRLVSATLDGDGNLSVNSHGFYQAECQDYLNSFIHRLSKGDQLLRLKSKFDLPTYDVNSFDYQVNYSKRLPVIIESLQLSVTDYAQVSGKRIFINPNILTRSTVKLAEDKNRIFDVDLKDEFSYADSVEINIPDGYETESRPKDMELQCKFGKYQIHTVITNSKIVYFRKFEQYSGRFPANDYGEVVKFYNEIYNSDHTKIVLIKKA
jgi:Domain of Unknown Function with PDB structure (DUF3857)/Transglutaminase-like superfamily